MFFAMLLVATDANQRDESEGKYLCTVNMLLFFYISKQIIVFYLRNYYNLNKTVVNFVLKVTR